MKKISDGVTSRAALILEVLQKHGELTIADLMKILNENSYTRIYYVLRILERKGLVKSTRRGRVLYWKINEDRINIPTSFEELKKYLTM